MQIPLGMASDRYGLLPIIVFGMVLFIAGGVICALAKNVDWIIAGRVIQGLVAWRPSFPPGWAERTGPELPTRPWAMLGASMASSLSVCRVLSPFRVGESGC